MNSIMGPLNAEPGTRWEYGTAIDWAGLVVENVSGKDLDTYFKVRSMCLAVTICIA